MVEGPPLQRRKNLLDPHSLPRTGSGDPRADWRNWQSGSYVPPLALASARPEPLPSDEPAPGEAGEGPGRRRRKPYKKRQPKPPFNQARRP